MSDLQSIVAAGRGARAENWQGKAEQWRKSCSVSDPGVSLSETVGLGQRRGLARRASLTAPYRIYLGLRGQTSATFGDAPFYFRPYVAMRGVAQVRYQADEIAQLEAELRWQFYKRFSVLGFVGGGGAFTQLEEFDSAQGVSAGGGGFRYELARRYGIHAGLDVAFSRDTGAIYVQIGSAWMRP